MAGYNFLLSILIFSIIVNFSVIFWVGKFYKYKCIIKIWLMIIGVIKILKMSIIIEYRKINIEFLY